MMQPGHRDNSVTETGRTPQAVQELGSQQPNTVAVDSRTGVVYVAGRTPGELQAIDTRTEQGDG
jgi:hypothetical protein